MKCSVLGRDAEINWTELLPRLHFGLFHRGVGRLTPQRIANTKKIRRCFAAMPCRQFLCPNSIFSASFKELDVFCTNTFPLKSRLVLLADTLCFLSCDMRYKTSPNFGLPPPRYHYRRCICSFLWPVQRASYLTMRWQRKQGLNCVWFGSSLLWIHRINFAFQARQHKHLNKKIQS